LFSRIWLYFMCMPLNVWPVELHLLEKRINFAARQNKLCREPKWEQIYKNNNKRKWIKHKNIFFTKAEILHCLLLKPFIVVFQLYTSAISFLRCFFPVKCENKESEIKIYNSFFFCNRFYVYNVYKSKFTFVNFFFFTLKHKTNYKMN